MLQCEDGGRSGPAGGASSGGSRRAVVISLSGVADLSDVGRLRSLLERALVDHREVRLDLSKLRAMDSACIRELLRAQALAAREQQVFGVVATSVNAHRVLERADALGLLLANDATGADGDAAESVSL